MRLQFLIEDESTEKLIRQIMEKFVQKYPEKEIDCSFKSFRGIGGLIKSGNPLQQKTGKLLNDLPMYLRAFNRDLSYWDKAALIIVLDNDKRESRQFRMQLEDLAIQNMVMIDHEFCIAVKETEAWLLGDANAIEQAYPHARLMYLKNYVQDDICDTWEVLANIVYPGGLANLKKRDAGSYSEIGKAKGEWADRIGYCLDLNHNQSPSFRYFIQALKARIEAA